MSPESPEKSSAQVKKRRENESSLLTELHFLGALARGEVSRKLHIRKSSVTGIVADFLEREVLVEDPPGAVRSKVGLNSKSWKTVVGHIEPKCLRAATVRFDGVVEGEAREDLPANSRPDAILRALASMLRRQLTGISLARVAGIGIAIPGITDAESGRGLHAVNLLGWDGVDVAAILAAELGHPVSVENDVRCQLLGNAWFKPEANRCANVYYLSIQQGVASAALVDGDILRGRRFAAGEIGCLRAGDEGRPCTCGKTDCLQTYAGVPALLASVDSALPQLELGSLSSLVGVAEGNPAVVPALDKAIEPLIPILATAVSILDPNAVLLATDDERFSELLRPLIELRLNRELLGLYTRGVDVLVAENAEVSTLQGMASILIRRAFGNGMMALA